MLKKFVITVLVAVVLCGKAYAENDKDFYGVIVGYKIDAKRNLIDVKVNGFIDPDDRERKFTIDLPAKYTAGLRQALLDSKLAPTLQKGKVEEKYTFFFYVPSMPEQVFSDWPSTVKAILEPRLRQFDIATLEQLGQQLVEEDAIAARATDAVLTKNIDLKTYNAIGWVTTGKQGDQRVTFVAEEAGQYYGVFAIPFKKGKAQRGTVLDKVPLTGDTLARFKARMLALNNLKEACSQKHNTIVLDDPDGAGYLVYALVPSIEENTIPVGGHYRFTIDATGEKLERMDKLFESCFDVNKGVNKDGKKPVGLFMTHMVSITPVETHVFLSTQNDIMFIVQTPDQQQWEVKQGKITKMQQRLTAEPKK
jgi:hypothetical protein